MRKKTLKEFINDSKSIWGDRFDYSQVEYVNSRTNVVLRCKIHNEVFKQKPFHHLVMRNCGCPKCHKEIVEKAIKRRTLTTEEFIKRSKEKFGNKFDYSKTNYISSKKEVEIICPKEGHGSFLIRPEKHLRSDYGCPSCANEHRSDWCRISRDEFVKRAQAKYGDRFDYSHMGYNGYENPITIVCNRHGILETTPFMHLLTKHGGCRKCSKESIIRAKASMTTEEYKEKAIMVFGNRYDYSCTKYESQKKKIKIRCPKHDYIFELLPQSHLNGKGCPICEQEELAEYERRKATALQERKEFRERQKLKRERYRQLLSGKKSTTPYGVDEFLRIAKLIHEDDFDYSLVKEQYINLNTDVTLICNKKHHVFPQKPIKHLRGQGCPYCIGRMRTTESFIEEAKEVHGNRYDYSKVKYVDYAKDVIITCPKHGDFKMRPIKHLRGEGCHECQTSLLEAKVITYLQSHLDMLFETQWQFEWLKTTRTMPLDIYIPDYKIAIECQGEEHFVAKAKFGGEKGFKKRIQNDKQKFRLCKKHGITMLYFAPTTYKVPKKYIGPVFTKLDELLQEIINVSKNTK